LAVADARRRARAYAEALGAGLGPVVSLAEAGAGHSDQPMMKREYCNGPNR
jgi:uncharacterized protein YggE